MVKGELVGSDFFRWISVIMLAPFDGPGRNRFGMVSCGEKGVSMGKPRPKAARPERFSTLGIPRTVLSLHSLMYRPKSAWGGRGVYYGSATPLRIAHMRRTVIGVSIEDETKKIDTPEIVRY